MRAIAERCADHRSAPWGETSRPIGPQQLDSAAIAIGKRTELIPTVMGDVLIASSGMIRQISDLQTAITLVAMGTSLWGPQRCEARGRAG